MSPESYSSDLVSVVIPCYNHGKYLAQAIESVLKQSYQSYEIIVVDDGSTDNSKKVAQSYPAVRYLYQQNQGPSMARNTGIDKSIGRFLVFLDADDWLFPDALKINIKYLLENEEAAFVSGSHQKVNNDGVILEEGKWVVREDPYLHLLQGNYIGMHATVMYRRSVLEKIKFDVSLRLCEDYDVYLKITRKYPVIHHEVTIAAYRIHDSNTSVNIPRMLEAALKVLERQRDKLLNERELVNYKNGLEIWENYYCGLLYNELLFKPFSFLSAKKEELATLKKFHLRLYLKLLRLNTLMAIKNKLGLGPKGLFV